MIKSNPFQEYKFPIRFNGKVYAISKDHVARFIPGWYLYDNKHSVPETILNDFNNTNQIYRLAYKLGLQTPKHEGIFNIEMRDISLRFRTLFFPIVVSGIVMQKVHGIPRNYIKNCDERKKADSQLEEQIKKAELLGFTPADSKRFDNSLWVPHEQRVYLVDLDLWDIDKNDTK